MLLLLLVLLPLLLNDRSDCFGSLSRSVSPLSILLLLLCLLLLLLLLLQLLVLLQEKADMVLEALETKADM